MQETLNREKTNMASPPEVLLEPEDSEALQAMLRAIQQIKRGISLKVGTPDTPLESMHVAKTMRDLLGDSPSQARVTLVAAQGQLTREELLKAVSALDAKAFETVSALESSLLRMRTTQRRVLMLRGRRYWGALRTTGRVSS